MSRLFLVILFVVIRIVIFIAIDNRAIALGNQKHYQYNDCNNNYYGDYDSENTANHTAVVGAIAHGGGAFWRNCRFNR
jgi:hypothetical protein